MCLWFYISDVQPIIKKHRWQNISICGTNVSQLGHMFESYGLEEVMIRLLRLLPA
jgi:hypothetical protein